MCRSYIDKPASLNRKFDLIIGGSQLISFQVHTDLLQRLMNVCLFQMTVVPALELVEVLSTITSLLLVEGFTLCKSEFQIMKSIKQNHALRVASDSLIDLYQPN